MISRRLYGATATKLYRIYCLFQMQAIYAALFLLCCHSVQYRLVWCMIIYAAMRLFGVCQYSLFSLLANWLVMILYIAISIGHNSGLYSSILLVCCLLLHGSILGLYGLFLVCDHMALKLHSIGLHDSPIWHAVKIGCIGLFAGMLSYRLYGGGPQNAITCHIALFVFGFICAYSVHYAIAL